MQLQMNNSSLKHARIISNGNSKRQPITKAVERAMEIVDADLIMAVPSRETTPEVNPAIFPMTDSEIEFYMFSNKVNVTTAGGSSSSTSGYPMRQDHPKGNSSSSSKNRSHNRNLNKSSSKGHDTEIKMRSFRRRDPTTNELWVLLLEYGITYFPLLAGLAFYGFSKSSELYSCGYYFITYLLFVVLIDPILKLARVGIILGHEFFSSKCTKESLEEDEENSVVVLN